MKTTLSVLIAALFLLTTPLLVAAHDDAPRKQSSERHSQSRDNDRYESRHDYRDQRAAYPFRRWARNQHRTSARPYYAHSPRELRYQRPIYASAPAVIIGVPRIVFRIDW